MIEFRHPLRDSEVTIEVTHVSMAPPNARACNPDDFYGYFDADYTVTSPAGEITDLTTDEDHDIVVAIKEWLYNDEE